MKKIIFEHFAVYGVKGFEDIYETYTDLSNAVVRVKELDALRYSPRLVEWYTEIDTNTGESRRRTKNYYSRESILRSIAKQEDRIETAIRQNLTLATINLYYGILKEYEQELEKAVW